MDEDKTTRRPNVVACEFIFSTRVPQADNKLLQQKRNLS